MFRFVLRRIGMVIPTFIGITILAFALIHLIPGDPIEVMMGERGVDPAMHAEAMKRLGLDQPLPLQYLTYVGHALKGDLGTSIITNTSVMGEFLARFPATVELSICAMIFALVVGLPAGVAAALKRGTVVDHSVMGTALTGYSMPIFWWGLILIMFFSAKLGWTPVSGRIAVEYDIPHVTGFMLIDSLFSTDEGAFTSALSHLILPTIVLGTIPLAVVARMTRSSMLEVLREDYIRTARAKGLSERQVILRHVLRNSLIPVVTLWGLDFGAVLGGGAILTETVFDLQGVGQYARESVQSLDQSAMVMITLFGAFFIVFLNTVVDIVYAMLDPRIRLT